MLNQQIINVDVNVSQDESATLKIETTNYNFVIDGQIGYVYSRKKRKP
jgi:hypothetical protein